MTNPIIPPKQMQKMKHN